MAQLVPVASGDPDQMIVITHRPSRRSGGWQYESESAELSGSARTFDKCKQSAEQAARRHLARLQGSVVRAEDARWKVFHVIELLKA